MRIQVAAPVDRVVLALPGRAAGFTSPIVGGRLSTAGFLGELGAGVVLVGLVLTVAGQRISLGVWKSTGMVALLGGMVIISRVVLIGLLPAMECRSSLRLV